MEPERPVEKLLRAYAQKRAEDVGPPDKLHPVNRRLLQDEVKRTFPRATRRRLASSWVANLLSPGVSWALAAFLVIGLVLAILLKPLNSPHQDVAMIAKNEVPPTTPPARDVVLEKDANVPVPPTASVSAPPQPALAESSTRSFAKGREPLEDTMGRTKVAEFSFTPTQNTPLMTNVAGAEMPTASKERETVAMPLNSFQVVQSGAEIKILDADGSIYTGSIQAAEPPHAVNTPTLTAQKQNSLNLAPVAPSASRRELSTAGGRQLFQSPLSQNYLVKVAGTNRTLNQSLVFNGTLTEFSATASQRPSTNTGSMMPANLRTGQFQQMPILKGTSVPPAASQITGQLKLQNGQVVEINALSPRE